MSNNIAKRIKERFSQLSQVYGIKRITIDMLAEECGISKKTFYKFFRSKDDLVWIVINEKFDQLQKEFREIDSREGDPLKKLYRFVEITLEQFGAVSIPMLQDMQKFYPEVNEQLERFRNDRVNLIKEAIREGILSGIFENINLSIVAGFLTGAISKVLTPEFILENNLSVEETLRSFSELFLFGIVKKEWQKEKLPQVSGNTV
jgi:TetR/AcrR family transcriptional regulator